MMHCHIEAGYKRLSGSVDKALTHKRMGRRINGHGDSRIKMYKMKTTKKAMKRKQAISCSMKALPFHNHV